MMQDQGQLEPPTTDVSLLESLDKRLSELLRHRNGVATNLLIDANGTYTRQETARILGVSLWTIDRARKDGLLVEVKPIGVRYVRITGDSLVTHLRRRKDYSPVSVRKI